VTRGTSFWDRRRAAVQAEAQSDAAAAQEAVEAEKQQALAERPDAEVLEELGLPDPETMKQGDDFTAFMTKTVPEHLRKRALRKLWRSNPVLACVDGLNDYDDDYLTGSFGNAPIQTSYRVGEGLLAHVQEVARLAEVDADDAMTLDKMEKLSETEESVEEAAQAEEPVATPDMAAEQVEDEDLPRPRRMTFHFDGNTA